MKNIPLHKLNDRVSSGLEVKHTNDVKLDYDLERLGIHRDDHYIFFLIEKGVGTLMVDFSYVTLEAGTVYYLLPRQVHHGIKRENGAGWFLAVDTALVPDALREIFENRLTLQQPFVLTEAKYQQCDTLIRLIHKHYNDDATEPLYLPILYSLLHSYLAIIANCYHNNDAASVTLSRPYQIASRFKKLLKDNYLDVKSPSWYAGKMNISESYLNEAVRKVTGSSVTHWITNEILIEAKRLLLYSDMNVKEISHTLGYDDHTYFSRLFKKCTSQTPLTFRTTNRK